MLCSSVYLEILSCYQYTHVMQSSARRQTLLLLTTMDTTPLLENSGSCASVPGSLLSSTRSSRRTSVSSVESNNEQWVKYLPPNAAEPDLFPCTWADVRRKIFPVEILFLLFMFGYYFFTQLYQQYYFQHLAKELLSNLPNYTAPTTIICFNQDYIVNHTNTTAFQNLQDKVNNLNMYSAIIYLSLSAIVALILGPLSDLIGRKPVMFYALLGLVFAALVQLFIVHLKASVYFYLIPISVFGAAGGHAALIGLVFAAVTDVTTSKKWLTIRMAAIEAAITLARAVSSVGVNNWINNNGCLFPPPAWLMFSVVIIPFVYLFLMSEPLTENLQRSSRRYYSGRQKLQEIFNGFKSFLNPSYIGFSNWWRLLIVTCIIAMEALTIIGNYEIINYFLHNKPLEWSYGRIGVYGAISSISMGFSLVCILPLLIAIKFSNALICFTASLFGVVTYIMMATVKTSWEMYLAGIFQGLVIISFPAVRSILTQLVYPKDLGAVFSITSSLQMIASIGSSVLFNKLYHPKDVVNGHTVNAGIVFWIAAGIWAASIPLILLLICCKRKEKSSFEKKDLSPPEIRGLLNSDIPNLNYSSVSRDIHSSSSIQ